MDEASGRVREAELQLRLARAELAAKAKNQRLLQKEADATRTVRNILIPRVFGTCMSCLCTGWVSISRTDFGMSLCLYE